MPMRASFFLILVFILQALLINKVSAEDLPFGRVFTSPEERKKLDGLREKIALDANFVNEEIAAAAKASPASEAPKKEDIQLSGYILREDGSAMIWINGRSELSGLNSQEVKTTTPRANQAQVTVRMQGKARSLKPGQIWSLNKDRVLESYLTEPTKTLAGSQAADDAQEVTE